MSTFLVLLFCIGLIMNSYFIGSVFGSTKNKPAEFINPNIYIEKLTIINNEKDVSRIDDSRKLVLDAEWEDVQTYRAVSNPKFSKAIQAYERCMEKHGRSNWYRQV